MKKLMAAAILAAMLAGCGSGDNASSNSGAGGNSSACGSEKAPEEAPELKGLEGDELAMMKEAVALRKDINAWISELKAQSAEERKAAKADIDKRFNEIGKKYSDLKKRARALGEEGEAKFKDILKEIDEMGDSVEKLVDPDSE